MYDGWVTDVKRGYDTTRRRAQAEATRQDVLDAAGRLFASAGYAATTVDEIAAEAGVSRETIFKAFGAKREVLRLWVEREVAGPEEPVPIQQQAWVRQIREAPEQRTQLETAVAAVCRIHVRTLDAIEVMRAAAHADAEIAALWDHARRQRRQDVRMVTELITATGPTRPDLDTKELVDVTYALTSPDLYDLLVRQCRWQPERFEQWLVESLLHLVLGPPRN
jgi:TetR/AcrR family transcriptional regulator, regulator of autoinduction and epiphytic fitness